MDNDRVVSEWVERAENKFKYQMNEFDYIDIIDSYTYIQIEIEILTNADHSIIYGHDHSHIIKINHDPLQIIYIR